MNQNGAKGSEGEVKGREEAASSGNAIKIAPATILHAKPKSEKDLIKEKLSSLRLEVMNRLISLVKSGNAAAYANLQELLLDIANQTDKRTLEIVSSWHDEGVVAALADLPSTLSDVNGYSSSNASAFFSRDRLLHSFAKLLVNGTLLGRVDSTLSRQIGKYSKEYEAAVISSAASCSVASLPTPPSRSMDHKR